MENNIKRVSDTYLYNATKGREHDKPSLNMQIVCYIEEEENTKIYGLVSDLIYYIQVSIV